MNIRFHLPGGKAAAGRKQKAAATEACLNSAGKKEEIRVTGQACAQDYTSQPYRKLHISSITFTGV